MNLIMRKSHLFTALAAFVMIVCALPVSAQFRIGPRVGLNINELHFNDRAFDSQNRAGFNAGVMAEFTVPVLGIGADVSAMYVRRGAKWMEDNKVERGGRDYIEIPVNFKWRINIPVVNKIIRPYLTTGPSFAFLTSSRAIGDAFQNSKFDSSWNFGFGLEFVQRLQIGASYGIGMSKAVKGINVASETVGIEGRNRYWTISAAYLFGF